MEMLNYHSLLGDAKSRKFETYSYLTQMDDKQLGQQIQAVIDKNWQIAIEHVEPESSNTTYWYMWKLPMFGEKKLDVVLEQLHECVKKYPSHVVKIIGYDPIRQSQGMAMVVHKPPMT